MTIAPLGEVEVWRAVAAACHAMSAELNTEALVALAATKMRELARAQSASVFVVGADATLVRCAHAGDPASEDDPPETASNAYRARAEQVGAFDMAFPLNDDGIARGVVHVSSACIESNVRAGLRAMAVQLALGLRQASVYQELETLVEREMVAAVEREQAIQLVLDTMTDGLLVCDLAGGLTPIRSKVLAAWFGPPEPGQAVWAYLGGSDTAFAQKFEMAFIEMAADVLPFEVNATLIPKILQRGDRSYTFGCRQVLVDGSFAQIVITVTDVTDTLVQEKLAREARELPDIVGNLLRDRDGFTAMMAETEALIGALAREEEGAARSRIIHTLKGNSSTWGFATFAHECHALEDVLDGDASGLRPAQTAALASSWMDALRAIAVFINIGQDDQSATLHVSRVEHEDVLERLKRGDDHGAIAAAMREWTQAPLSAPFETLARQAERLAQTLGKEVRVVVDARGRVPALPITALVAELVHAVRNAIDHGIEAPDERTRRGKNPTATLRLSAAAVDNVLRVVVEDDGRGVDWGKVRTRADELGLSALTTDAAHEALFASGLSTATAVSSISGRGVGMASVREAFRRLGGDVHVESCGSGTRVVCYAPVHRAHAGR